MTQASHFPPTSSDAPQQWQGLLDRLCADARLLGRFVNTLSLLEHIGSRKIMASQSRTAMDGATLKHLSEETRHAFFLKRMAETLAGRTLGYEAADILAGPEARAYMGRLDAFIARTAQGHAAYLYMSLVVELRAIWFYQLFQDALKKAGQKIRLSSLLAEEKSHLTEMRAHLAALGEDTGSRLPAYIAYEETLFTRLTGSLARTL